MHQQTLLLNQIPALLYYQSSAEQAALRGTILFYHGFSACKEKQHKDLSSLAEQGYLAIGLDNAGHGARLLPNFEAHFSDPANAMSRFHQLLHETVHEVPALIDELILRSWAHSGRIGITGISMGGYIAYGAAARERRISAAAPILASPQWPGPLSPHLQPQCFFPLALLSQNCGRDEKVPPHFARQFRDKLAPYYQTAPQRLRHVEFHHSGHVPRAQDWQNIWTNVLHWFEAYLG